MRTEKPLPAILAAAALAYTNCVTNTASYELIKMLEAKKATFD